MVVYLLYLIIILTKLFGFKNKKSRFKIFGLVFPLIVTMGAAVAKAPFYVF